MSYFDECKKNYGIIMSGDIEYALNGQPYFDNIGTDGQVAFFASGFSRDQLDAAGGDDIDCLSDEHIKIQWDCDEWWNDGDNEDDMGNACDWDNPVDMTIIN